MFDPQDPTSNKKLSRAEEKFMRDIMKKAAKQKVNRPTGQEDNPLY